ncbi:MAG: hypothetical protein ACOY7J_21665 [Pseudomonadota bacterium]
MITYSQHEQPAQTLALHYAAQAGDALAQAVYGGQKEVHSREDALSLTRFFWAMSDAAAEDYRQDTELARQYDLEFWMEKLMNKTIGYLAGLGYRDLWTEESNRINS